MPSLLKRIEALESDRLADEAAIERDFSVYRDDPPAFLRDILKQEPTPDQERIMRACLEPPYRVLVPAGHNVGKTFISAAMVLWFHYTQGPNAIINSTAPSYQALNDVLWGRIRHMSREAGLPCSVGATPNMRFAPMWYAKGMTADKMGSFTGRHATRNAFVVDEAIDVSPKLFPVIQSMMSGERFFTLMIYNPVDPGSPLRIMEELGPDKWTVIRLSQDKHPNIEAGRRGLKPPFPDAITLELFEQEIMERSDPVIGDPLPTDIFINWRYGPDGERVGGEWRRPGYEADCRNLGRWPSVSSVSIWSPELFRTVCEKQLPLGGTLQIGCDVARFGNCNTVFAVRRGGNLLRIESYNGWDSIKIADRAKELCYEFGKMFNVPAREVPVLIDDTGGWGTGVVDNRENYSFIGINCSEKAWSDSKYFLKRDELWCGLRDAAYVGDISIAMIPKAQQELLRQQALAAKYEYRGTPMRKKVLPKVDMAELLNGRSPDEWEAVQLSWCDVTNSGRETVTGRVTA